MAQAKTPIGFRSWHVARSLVDPQGYLVYPATVRRVEGAAVLMLEYDDFRGEAYPERVENVTPARPARTPPRDNSDT